jgi:hypothetical protein
MFNLIFHPHVSQEVKVSYNWYQEKAAGLGDDFITELEFSFETIKEYPLGWPIIRNDFHRFVLPKFPFSVIYKLNSNSIYVVAVMHNSRKPDYWLNRK